MTNRKYLFCALALLLTALFAPLQPQAVAQKNERGGHRFSPEQFTQRIDAFITEQAKLSQQETQKVLPLLHAMRDAQRKLLGEKGRILRSAVKGELAEAQAQKSLERIGAIESQVLDIEADYQKKMLKVISASKLLCVQAAEKRFERMMLRRMASPPKEPKK